MRGIRSLALGAAMLALIVGACSSGGGGSSTIAGALVLGGPPECPQRPFCAVGLEETYGLTFKEFRPLDAGGPVTVEAVRNGQVDVGLLFTSDPAIVVNNFVLLEDDKGLQLADNLVPVLRREVLDATPEVAEILDAVSAELSQEALTELNRQVLVDQADPADVASAWLAELGLTAGSAGSGKQVTVGSTNFYEQETLGEIFAQVLESNGFTVERKFGLGNREIVFPALESGEIDVLAEYAATALEFVNGGAGEASTDPVATTEALRAQLEPMGLTALEPAPATDQNGFVVTRETAESYGLVTLSDLAKPLP